MTVANRQGFSLLEALIALAVLAVAATALLTAAQAHIDGVRRLEDRVIGQWIAENRLAEVSVGAARLGDTVQERFMGRDWAVETRAQPTDDPGLTAVVVTVRRAGSNDSAAVLHGFTAVSELTALSG